MGSRLSDAHQEPGRGGLDQAMTAEAEAALCELLDEIAATQARMVEQLADHPDNARRGAQVDPLHPPGRC